MADRHSKKEESGIDVPADGTIDFAREYYASDFPNPDRIGCPSADALRRVSASRDLPDDATREHLLSCSPCLIEFRRFRFGDAGRSSHTVPLKAFAAGASVRMLHVFLLMLSVVGILVGLTFLSETQTSVDVVKLSEPTDAPQSGIEGDFSEVASSSSGSGNNSNRQSDKISRTAKISTVAIDLSSYAVSRNSSDGSAAASLPAELTRFRIKLRPGSSAGSYRFVLFNDFGNAISGPISSRSDGKTASAVIDLTSFSGTSRLCVVFGDEVPDCVPLNVSKTK